LKERLNGYPEMSRAVPDLEKTIKATMKTPNEQHIISPSFILLRDFVQRILKPFSK
jgi:hypothetical protein